MRVSSVKRARDRVSQSSRVESVVVVGSVGSLIGVRQTSRTTTAEQANIDREAGLAHS
jgi:hypothetical protein